MSDKQHRRTLISLTVSLSLHMLGVSTLFTVFARKIASFGEGLAVFGLSATAFSIAALVSAPLMGMLADRWGRRPVLLLSLSSPILLRVALLLAPTGAVFIGVRALTGGLTAGLIPAYSSIIADLVPSERRGRWIGYVSGGSALGFATGPILGGWSYDHWGLAVPFLVAAFASICASLIPLFLIPETNPEARQAVSADPQAFPREKPLAGLLKAVPRPYGSFALLLVITFSAIVAWRFSEPQFNFYIYDDLGWTSARYGACISGYSLLAMISQMLLGSLSDRYGRKPILMGGLLVHAAQYVALLTTQSFGWIAFGVAGSGFGEGLFFPALDAFYLDFVPQEYSARVMGLRESVFSLAGLVGPALAVVADPALPPKGVFAIGGSLIILAALLVPLVVTPTRRSSQRFASSNQGSGS